MGHFELYRFKMSTTSLTNRKLQLLFLLLTTTVVGIIFKEDLGMGSYYKYYNISPPAEPHGSSNVLTRAKFHSTNLEVKRDKADIQIGTSITNESLYTFGTVRPSAVYLKLKGGLGNQLFQYACHYAIARKNNWPLYTFVSMNVSKSLRKFNVRERAFALDYFNIPLYKWNMVDESWNVSSKIEYVSDSTILSGLYSRDKVISQVGRDYCGSEAFFSPYKVEIRQMFTQKIIPSSPSVQQWLSLIKGQRESVAVHIRRTDFIPINTTIPISFHRQAMEMMERMLDNLPTFFIFTDDADYAKQEFLSDVNEVNQRRTIFVVSLSNLSSLEDFYLMSKCKHDIIPNSSFSWWAAYLNSNPKKIVIAAHQQNKLFDFMFPGPSGAAVRDFHKFVYRHLYYPYEWITIDPFL